MPFPILIILALVGRPVAFGLHKSEIQFVSPEEKYIWYRNDGDQFLVEYVLDPIAKRITVIEHYSPAPSTKEQTALPKGSSERIITYFEQCTIKDEKNWSCPTRNIEKEYIFMNQGQLVWFYWGEVRRLKLNKPFWKFW